MFAAAATRMGYRVEAVVESADCPAARHARRIHVGLLDDPPRLLEAARAFAAVTYEFENVPVAAARALEGVVPVLGERAAAPATAGEGITEAFLARHGFLPGG